MTVEEILLVQLMEECAEVTKRASKAIRFTLAERENDEGLFEGGSKVTNGDRLSHELTDLFTVGKMLVHIGALPNFVDADKFVEKEKKVNKFLKYSVDLGIIEINDYLKYAKGVEKNGFK